MEDFSMKLMEEFSMEDFSVEESGMAESFVEEASMEDSSMEESSIENRAKVGESKSAVFNVGMRVAGLGRVGPCRVCPIPFFVHILNDALAFRVSHHNLDIQGQYLNCP